MNAEDIGYTGTELQGDINENKDALQRAAKQQKTSAIMQGWLAHAREKGKQEELERKLSEALERERTLTSRIEALEPFGAEEGGDLRLLALARRVEHRAGAPLQRLRRGGRVGRGG